MTDSKPSKTSSYKVNTSARSFENLDKPEHANELKLPGLLSTASLIRIRDDFDARPDDVYVAVYPKAGTTWTQNVLAHLLKKEKNAITGGLTKSEAVPWLNFSLQLWGPDQALEFFKDQPSPRYMKSHTPLSLIKKPPTGKLRIIQTLRHPLDTFVSFWHHHMRDPQMFGLVDVDFSSFFQELVLTDKVAYGDCILFHEEYLKAAQAGEIDALFLKFWEMKTPEGAVEGVHKMAKFIGVTDYDAEIIAEKTSFKSMKSQVSKHGMAVPDFKLAMTEKKYAETVIKFDHGDGGSAAEVSKEHIRKGAVGDWVNYLSEEDLKLWQDYVMKRVPVSPLVVETYGLDALLGKAKMSIA